MKKIKYAVFAASISYCCHAMAVTEAEYQFLLHLSPIAVMRWL